MPTVFTTTLCIVFLEHAETTCATGFKTISGIGSWFTLSFALLLSCCSCSNFGESPSRTNKAGVLRFLGLVASRYARLALLGHHIEVGAHRTVDWRCMYSDRFVISIQQLTAQLLLRYGSSFAKMNSRKKGNAFNFEQLPPQHHAETTACSRFFHILLHRFHLLKETELSCFP